MIFPDCNLVCGPPLVLMGPIIVRKISGVTRLSPVGFRMQIISFSLQLLKPILMSPPCILDCTRRCKTQIRHTASKQVLGAPHRPGTVGAKIMRKTVNQMEDSMGNEMVTWSCSG